MLAYVFWHAAAPGIARAEYEARLAAFHAGLRADPPAGLAATAALALEAVPWLEDAAGYEDWYLVADFGALGSLNHGAVSGTRRASHDAAAAVVRAGVAGVMGLVAGAGLPRAPRHAAWLSKPDGMAYDAFHAALAEALAGEPEASAWQRQMVLGPAAEYCVLAAGELALPWPARSWPVSPVVAPAAPG